jgi:hypothetical protein
MKKKLLILLIPVLLILIPVVVLLFQSLTSPKVQLTSGFPTTPVYSHALLTSSSKSFIEKAGMSYKSSWSVSASVPTVVKWYMDNLQSSGWKIEIPPANLAAEDIQFLEASKDGSLPIQLSVIRKGNYTEVTAEFIPIKPEQEEK